MDAGRHRQVVALGDADRAFAVGKVFADGEHCPHAGGARSRDNVVAIFIELSVLDVTVRVDHSPTSFARRGPLSLKNTPSLRDCAPHGLRPRVPSPTELLA